MSEHHHDDQTINLQIAAYQCSCLDTGETDQVGAQAEACTLASREPNAGGQEIQKREGHCSDDGDCEHLLHVRLLHGDDEGG